MITQTFTCSNPYELKKLAHMVGFTLGNLPRYAHVEVKPAPGYALEISGPAPLLALIGETFEALRLEWARERFEALVAYTAPMPKNLKRGESSRPKIVPLRLPSEDHLGL